MKLGRAFLLSAAAAPHAAAGVASRRRVQRNHMYRGETMRTADAGSSHACAKYEDDPSDLVYDRARYPWRRGVRSANDFEVLYGTGYAQRVIWAHQHPEDCSQAKFLTMLHWPSGLGALLHFLGRALGLAMHLGRVLVLSVEDYNPKPGEPGMPWYDGQLCPERVSWECWFQPLSGCTEGPSSDTLVIQPEHLGRFRAGNFSRHYAPEVFWELLRKCSGLKRELEFHWWHAQSIAYIVRFNAGTRRLLDSLRDKLLHVRSRGSHRQQKLRSLPPGTVAMHVRHGDKAVEMPLLPFARYLREARRLAAGDRYVRVLGPEFADGDEAFVYPQSFFASRTMFVSTEDPHVIEEAAALAEAPRRESWDVIFTVENRTNAGVAAMRRERGNGRATLESLLNLELALEADAWVCTLLSNWCQLIDELRMTVAGKASAPFVNLVREGYRRGEGCPAFDRGCYVSWR